MRLLVIGKDVIRHAIRYVVLRSTRVTKDNVASQSQVLQVVTMYYDTDLSTTPTLQECWQAVEWRGVGVSLRTVGKWWREW